jgi:predicted NAD/FAD-dependent oxidoreductase
MKDYIIIGAGLCGLSTAKKITELNLGSVLILEKSRGVGGRMATRRTLNTRFDHGAQFYRVKSDIAQFHKIWKENLLSHQWFVSYKGDHWCANDGMTSLAKKIASGLEIQLEKQVQQIFFENNIWRIVSDKNEEWLCKHLIITAPLPQAIQLIERSSLGAILNLSELEELKKIQYSKALIGLVVLEEDFSINEHGYEEYSNGDFFSIADQKSKGISQNMALTLTMSPHFSEIEFEGNDEVTLQKILKIFLKQFPKTKIKEAELKKWRYCQPTGTYKNFTCEIAPKLYLAGDSFGGSSLLGAVRSSVGLTKVLLEN